jgi:hypothetical protein
MIRKTKTNALCFCLAEARKIDKNRCGFEKSNTFAWKSQIVKDMAQYKTKKAKKNSKVSSRSKKQKVTKLSKKQDASIDIEDPKFNAVVLPVNDELSIVEKAKLILNAGCSVNGNEFSKMRYDIASKIVDYDRIRKECKIHVEAQSKTIYRLAKPFS